MQLIYKKMGDRYVRMGASSVIKLFNPNLRGHILFVCFLFVGLSMATITGKPPGVFMGPACPTTDSRILLVRIS